MMRTRTGDGLLWLDQKVNSLGLFQQVKTTTHKTSESGVSDELKTWWLSDELLFNTI